MNTKEILIAARAKIADPACWTQGLFARRADGRAVLSRSPSAVQWCAIGAVTAVSPGSVESNEHAYQALETALYDEDSDSPQSVVDYNDSHTHAEVLALFDKAIEGADG